MNWPTIFVFLTKIPQKRKSEIPEITKERKLEARQAKKFKISWLNITKNQKQIWKMKISMFDNDQAPQLLTLSLGVIHK